MASNLIRVALVLVACYALLVLATFLLQRRMLYFPDTNPPSPQQLAAIGLARWPGAGGYRGVIGTQPQLHDRGTVLVFHGNAGAAWQRSYYVDALQPLGFRVILVEYPGYGGRPGAPSEDALVADAQETLRRTYAEYGAPIYLWGESLGSGVASAVAAAPAAPVAGVVLLTPWDALPDLAQSLYPFLPVRWLLLDRYDNMRNLANVTVPVAVVVAERDEIIPPARAERLYASLSAPKRRWLLPRAGHNSWPTAPGLAWWREVMAFVADSPA